MNTTNVPTEWFRELIEINNKIIEASTKPVNERDWSFYIGCLQSHIYNYKYFNQPEQSSELEEFATFLRRYKYDAVLDRYERINSFGTFFTFSEVLKAFQNREK